MSKTQAAVMTETPTKAKRIPVAWPALVTAVVLIAAGVAYPWARGAVANYRADKALVSAIAAIGRGGDPWENFTALQHAERDALEATRAKSPHERERVSELERRWLRDSLGQGNLVAAAALFPDPARSDAPIYEPSRFADLRAENVDKVLIAAEAAIGRQAQPIYTDRWMLHAAANIHASGTDRPRNVPQALQLYAAAFAAGDALAALGAVRMAKELGQTEEAYRWALRCAGPCRTPGFDLSTYQAGLSNEAIAKAQGETMP
ncbi:MULTISPECIES: hypothetical protein [unclassified Rhodanobacter]|uniref:hypothetical protein n=1 Tax=unclassified Rhodanobacter TaxID=2621553 RepID=UPI0007AA4BBD|nr:hypothetical protein [Rhodanobacter sp. FW510-R10]KZC32611.1 hypothetical protein RhoFW510R10_11900 [Rhodanobacter sp. FW510-R10]